MQNAHILFLLRPVPSLLSSVKPYDGACTETWTEDKVRFICTYAPPGTNFGSSPKQESALNASASHTTASDTSRRTYRARSDNCKLDDPVMYSSYFCSYVEDLERRADELESTLKEVS